MLTDHNSTPTHSTCVHYDVTIDRFLRNSADRLLRSTFDRLPRNTADRLLRSTVGSCENLVPYRLHFPRQNRQEFDWCQVFLRLSDSRVKSNILAVLRQTVFQGVSGRRGLCFIRALADEAALVLFLLILFAKY